MRVLRLAAAALLVASAFAQTELVRTRFRVKEVASGGMVYLDGGASDGLTAGMRLKVTHLAPGDAQMNRKEVATISVYAVADHSAVCEIKESTAPPQAGDSADLFESDAQAVEMTRTSKSARKYPQVVSFTMGDPI
ncbi:MAG: hypothetical protein LUO89_09635, partial [Methanothrix sp.]|nr:hypothetical protein [Methanothrix sp.]